MTPRIAIITNVIPDYRAEFYQRLIVALGSRLTIYCQAQIPGLNLPVAHGRFANHVRLVKHHSLARERIAWQWLPFPDILQHDVYFFTGNPRVLSTFVIASLLRALGRDVVIWGQYHTAGARDIPKRCRLWWWRRFHYVFVYTDKEVEQLRNRGFSRQTLIGMNNGLDQRAIEIEKSRWSALRLTAWRGEHQLANRRIVISCARLIQKNRFEQMIAALPAIVERFPDVLWIAIGDGAERESLQRRAQEMHIADHIRWVGALHAERELAPWFLSADLFVHPGAIGLSLLHAYGYGLPVVTHNDHRQQMPEFGALADSNRPYCCNRDDSGDLAEKICTLLNSTAMRAKVSEDALAVTERFNVDVMALRFLAMVDACTRTPAPLPKKNWH